MKIVSIQVGRPRSVAGAHERAMRTGFGKERALLPVRATAAGLAGDGQANLKYHGGPDQIALAYSAEHYPVWREELDWPSLGHGGLGENLTVSGAEESSVCIGDTWRCAGGAVLQVTSPRTPCQKIAQFHGRIDLLRRVAETGWGGWYLRCLEEGDVAEGPVELVARPHPDWSVARTMEVFVDRRDRRAEAMQLAGLAELNARWSAAL